MTAAWTPLCRACAGDGGDSWARCAGCGGVRVLKAPPITAGMAAGPTRKRFWRYRSFLPPVTSTVSLGEGGTPLIACTALGGAAGEVDVRVKNEGTNPTLSFKDRAMALGVSLARGHGAAGVIAASTGNTAASAAAYAARAGLPCRIVCAASAARGEKVRTAQAFGARLQAVEGDFSTAYAAAAAAEDDGWYPLTTTFRNPHLAEAHRTVAYEILDDTAGRVPDWVIVPVGAGPLLVGIHRGFTALAAAGRTDRVPRLVAVQAQACAPLAAAWRAGADTVTAPRARHTVAGAIADPLRGYEDEGLLTLEAVRDSGGLALAVGDEDILAAAAHLARREGILAEPAAAAPLAALRTLAARGTVAAGSTVVLVATGHAAKETPPPSAA